MRLEARWEGNTSGGSVCTVDTIQNRDQDEDKLNSRREKTSFFQTNPSNFQSRQVIFHCTRYLIVCDLFHPLCEQKKGIRGDDPWWGWPDPTDHDKQARGEVVGDHVEGHLPRQHQLEPRGAVVHPDGLVVRVTLIEGLECDLVIQDGLDAVVIRNKLKTNHSITVCFRHYINNLTSDRKVILLIG